MSSIETGYRLNIISVLISYISLSLVLQSRLAYDVLSKFEGWLAWKLTHMLHYCFYGELGSKFQSTDLKEIF